MHNNLHLRHTATLRKLSPPSICFLLLAGLIFSPLFTILFLTLAITLLKPAAYNALPISILALYILLNLARLPDGDYLWYSKHYIWLSTGDFLGYFGKNLFGVSAKITEPVYHLYAKILSVIFSGDMSAYVIITTAIIYGIYYKAACIYQEGFGLDNISKSGVLVAALTLCITFTLSNHLIRQCIASTLLILSFSFLHKHSWRNALLAASLALLTHNSVSIPLIILIISHFTAGQKNNSRLILIAFGSFFSWVLGHELPRLISTNPDIYLQNDGSISVLTIIYDTLCFTLLAALYLFLKSRKALNESEKRTILTAIIFYILFSLFLMSSAASPLILLRNYLYIEIFRLFAFLCIFKALSRYNFKAGKRIALITILCLGLVNVGTRMDKSAFNYGKSLQSYIFSDLTYFLDTYHIRANQIN